MQRELSRLEFRNASEKEQRRDPMPLNPPLFGTTCNPTSLLTQSAVKSTIQSVFGSELVFR